MPRYANLKKLYKKKTSETARTTGTSYCRLSLLALALLSFASCGYRWGHGSVLDHHQSLSIPYVQGDDDGTFTAELINRFSKSGLFNYSTNEGALTLQVSLIDFRDENVGFQYDLNKEGKVRNILIPTETRRIVIAEVAVVNSLGCTVLGPVKISADVVFDHDYYSNRNGINVFSLGQLTDIDAAQEAATIPLYRRLAQKILDYVINS